MKNGSICSWKSKRQNSPNRISDHRFYRWSLINFTRSDICDSNGIMSDWLENPARLLLGLLFIIILIACLTLFGERGLLRLHRMQEELMELAEENKSLAAENRALEREIMQLRSDRDYLEKLAREELGLIREGEVVYHFLPGRPDRTQQQDESTGDDTKRQ